MESTAYFEKKLSLTPLDLNRLKEVQLEEILTTKSKEIMENKCSEHGYVLPGSVEILSRSMGYFEAARFTGDVIYYVKLKGRVVYPADGVRIKGEVIRKNKMGLYVEYNKAIRVQVPRDLHLGNDEFDSVDIGDVITVELKRSKFQINDPYILASGIFVSSQEEEKHAMEDDAVESGPMSEDEESDQEEESEGEEEGEGSEEEEGEEEEEDSDQGEEEKGSNE